MRCYFILAQLVAATAFAAGAYETPVARRVPYVATYYVQPLVTTGDVVRVGYYVTDWTHAKTRFGDDSKRFRTELRYAAEGGAWNVLQQTDVGAGDHTFELGKLPRGDYRLALRAWDEENRVSHTVWQEFRCRKPEEIAIPESAIRRMTEEDFARYGISTETNLYSYTLVETPDATTVATPPDGFVPPAKGYAIFAPCANGILRYGSWNHSTVVYGADWDAAAVATRATNTLVGLQRLIDDAHAAGCRKLVLLKDTYRLFYTPALEIPSDFTLDLNGATLKIHQFTGANSHMVAFTHVNDAHLVNGTLEGDYYEHDYAHSPNNSEWVLGSSMEGGCRDVTIENVNFFRITGYGAGNGTRANDHTWKGSGPVSLYGKDCYAAGALDLSDGSVHDAANLFTCDYTDISKFTNGWLSVSKYLGYQGIATRSWLVDIAFYDRDKSFLSGDRTFQYRVVPIPSGAKYLRVTIECETLDETNDCSLRTQLFRLPQNCAYRNCSFKLCRAVGLAPAAMRNMLIEGNDFSWSGDTLATCAFDAEDGWDSMQDVFVRNNVFHDNPKNEFLTCAGHNFVVENNVGNLCFYARCNSPCVRSNASNSACFECGASRNRTLYGRYEGNSVKTSLKLGNSSTTEEGWDIVISERTESSAGTQLTVAPSATGRFRDCTLKNCKFQNANTAWRGVTFDTCNPVLTQAVASYDRCTFTNSSIQHANVTNVFTDCIFLDSKISPMSGGMMTLHRCAFTNSTIDASYWALPDSFDIAQCDVKGANSFIRLAAYATGRLLAHDSTFDTGAKPVFAISDLRKNTYWTAAAAYESLPGVIAIWNCRFLSTPVAATGGSLGSEKEMYFVNRNNEIPDGVDFLVRGKSTGMPWYTRNERDPTVETVASGSAVPLVWLDAHPSLFEGCKGNPEYAALTKTGKTSSDGTSLAAWQDYVQGTDPEDTNSVFTTSITIDENGLPVITWTPDLGDARTYETFGSTDLKEWHQKKEGDKFFRVQVSP